MKLPIALSAVLCLGNAASAQSFNVDLGVASVGTPSASYGGAAASPGVWNGIDPSGAMTPHDLLDVSGATTGVTLTTPVSGGVSFPNACLTGEDRLLLADYTDPLPGGAYVFEGLAPGRYTVICYSFAADDFTLTTDINVVGGSGGVQVVGGYDWCSTMMQGQGDTYSQHIVDVTAGSITITYDAGATLFETFNGFQLVRGTGTLGLNYCMATDNSTGGPSIMGASGSDVVSDQNFTLRATGLPANQFGIFVTSKTQAFLPGINGTSNGNLCLGGVIGRFNGTGQILASGANGVFTLPLDLTRFPQANGFVSVMPGESWNFQAWHRSSVGLGSNFTDGLEVLFL